MICSIMLHFTAENRSLPNPKKACIFQILEIYSRPEDFIGIYSKTRKAKAVSKKKAMKSLGTEIHHNLETSNCDPLKCTMGTRQSHTYCICTVFLCPTKRTLGLYGLT